MVITDPKIVKQLAVKDFDYFMDHRVVITEETDPILGNMLTALTGHKWKGENKNLNFAIFVQNFAFQR